MDGYYDYHPLHALDRPLVIAGYLADETRVVGFRLAALTGLPVNSLDRLVEHRAGKSVWDLIWNDGEPAYRRLESELLARSLRERPHGILALGDGALIDDDNLRQVRRAAHLVVLDLDLPNLYWRLKGSGEADKEFWHPLHAGPVERFEQIKPFYQRRQPGFASADHRVEMAGRGSAQTVERLIKLLGEL